MSPADLIVVGRVGAPYGVRGWVHVQSFTSPPDNILGYTPWFVRKNDTQPWQEVENLECRSHKKAVVACLNGIVDRDVAAGLRGYEIGVSAATLPAPENSDEYYWKDLVGAVVTDVQGQTLGYVDHLLETAAHDVLVVTTAEPGAPECLIPFVEPYVVAVDVAAKAITVDWDISW